MKGSSRPWCHRAEVLLAAHDAQEHAESYTTLARQHRAAGNVPLAIDMQRIAIAYRDSASQYMRDAKRLLREWRAASKALRAEDRRVTVATARPRPMPPRRKMDSPRGVRHAPPAAAPARRAPSMRVILRKYLRQKYRFSRIFR